MPRQIKLELIDQDFSVKGPKLKSISQAKRILNKNKIAPALNAKRVGNSIYDILTEIGVTIDAMDQADFSFKNDAKNIELLENPNILQRRSFSKLKNKKTDIRDKFNNEDDPFYELDEPRDSNSMQKETVNTIDKDDLLARIGKDIFALNRSNDQALKQFRSLD